MVSRVIISLGLEIVHVSSLYAGVLDSLAHATQDV